MIPTPSEVPTQESLVALLHAAAQEGSCLLFSSMRLYYGIDLDTFDDPNAAVKESVLNKLVQKGVQSGFRENDKTVKLKQAVWKVEDDSFLLYYLSSDEQMLIEGKCLSPEEYVLAPNEYHPEVSAAITHTPFDEHYGWHRVQTRKALEQEKQKQSFEDARFKEFAGIEQKRPVRDAVIKQEKLAEIKAKLLADQEKIVAKQARKAERNRIRTEKAAEREAQRLIDEVTARQAQEQTAQEAAKRGGPESE